MICMKGFKKKRANKVNRHADAAINSDKIALWASKNGYEWKNFSYWKNEKEVPIMEVYDLWNNQQNRTNENS